MTSTINSSNLYTKAAYGLSMARQREQLRQEVQEALPSLKIGQIVYCWRDELDSDGEPIDGQGQYEAARVIRIAQSKFNPGKWLATVQRFESGPGRWTMSGPVDAFKTYLPGVDDVDESELQAAIDQIRVLVKDRAESDILARKVWNICRAVS